MKKNDLSNVSEVKNEGALSVKSILFSLLISFGAAVILFLILAAITISFLDNFLRPFFLKDRIKVHPLIIFFAILGGIQLFGMNGLLLGPLVIILFFTILDILSNNEKETSLSDDD